ncbi:endo alpha-1,4 polygalactosaminidase [Kitasatospora viridis]|uniref:Glycoside-hydrolase family GH114 TIM-barrel domain-containing protein n=1 Tax=Kitasatospora viridis TaxID=281105 RepID=A0A561T788_9ACTN|nr:endo alpha-1,4 polygalactosaminidase [Kitasatospora viridis]TWF82969.1 hypothetical protein FHX73_14452 [Kitasatospora viridis]
MTAGRAATGWWRALLLAGLLVALAGCAGDGDGDDGGAPSQAASPTPPASPVALRWTPTVGDRWQYQLQTNPDPRFAATGGVDVDGVCVVPVSGGAPVCPQVWDVDLFDVSGHPNSAAVTAIHRRGGRAVCYLDVGALEKGRPDEGTIRAWAAEHPGAHLIGGPVAGYEESENWLNIGDSGAREFLVGVMAARMAECAAAGFDGVEGDLVEAYQHPRAETGSAIGADDQLVYNRSLADAAHRYGLAAGLKNDAQQAPELGEVFDFSVDESCVRFDECQPLADGFLNRGKPVFHVEYLTEWQTGDPSVPCRAASALGFSTIVKQSSPTLADLPYHPCR